MNRIAALMCLFAGAIFAAMASLVLFTKLTSPSVRAVLFIAAFGLAAYGCFRAAARLWRPSERSA